VIRIYRTERVRRTLRLIALSSTRSTHGGRSWLEETVISEIGHSRSELFSEPVEDSAWLDIECCNGRDDGPKGTVADSALKATFGVVNREVASEEAVNELLANPSLILGTSLANLP
jgi:hypothetical protein